MTSAWGDADKLNWFREQSKKRSYQDEVVSKILKMSAHSTAIQVKPGTFEITQYGAINVGLDQYPLFLIKSLKLDPHKKTVLITGGVHGYETSGVHGALAFFDHLTEVYLSRFNFICAPCLSPWAYETINRWNSAAIDPNRSFYKNSPAEECRLFLHAMDQVNTKIDVHFDLHETTDTDNTVFRPALAQRDGIEQELSEIPDGFYLVGDSSRPKPEFDRAIIEAVKKVTHIAQPDHEGKLIGVPIEQEGVVYYDMKKLFLCGGFSNAEYTITTEVYPDSPQVTPQNCIDAQVAAICGGLEFFLDTL